nr:family 16 glycosylhydrolase [Bacteroides sp.]
MSHLKTACRRLLLLGAGSFLAVSAQAQNFPGQSADPAGWRTVWYDHFEGNALNSANWNIEVNNDGGGNGELQHYGPEGVSVRDGNLVLTAAREWTDGREFYSGRVNTMDKAFFTHGKVEARIKLPKTEKGLWPAFWMLGNDFKRNGWPYCGEIDILESGHFSAWGTDRSEYLFNGACHWGPDWNQHAQYARECVDYHIQDGNYHTYTLVWDDQRVKMFIDGNEDRPYYEMTIDSKANANDPGNFFHKPNFIIFNLAVGGQYSNFAPADQLTAFANGAKPEMLVDWVRISQPENDDRYSFMENIKDEQDSDETREDPDTKPGRWGSRAVDDAGNFTFNVNNASDIVLISTSRGVTDMFKNQGRVRADYNVDNQNNFFYIWDNTYAELPSKGVNSFGFEEDYTALEVNAAWSGAGFASAEGRGKNLTMLDEENYVLHFSLRGTDYSTHRGHTFNVGNAAFEIGRPTGSAANLGDYPRDGRWYSYDIPVKVLKNLAPTLFDNPAAFEGNVLAFLSGGAGGTRIQIDNIFFYKSASGIIDLPTTDNETNIGRYASKSLENNQPTFDFANSYGYVPVMVSDNSWNRMNGKVALDCRVGVTTNLYNWEETYVGNEATGLGSMGDNGQYTSYTVGTKGWSGAGITVPGQNLDLLTNPDNHYWLHFAMKGDDILLHAPHTLSVGKASITIGSNSFVGDYRRDGEWYSFDIPVSDLMVMANPLFPADLDNMITLSSGGSAGVRLQIDNIFFYRNDTRTVNSSDDTPCGPYMSKSVANGKSTFDWNKADKVIPVMVSDNVHGLMAGKVRAGYDVADTQFQNYVWDQTFVDTNNGGANSFGFNEAFFSAQVGTVGWSGGGLINLNARDFSVLSSEPDYYLHLAVRDKDYMTHKSFTFTVNGKDLVIGSDGITDFTRDGEWYSIDIPVSKIAEGLFNGAGNFADNIITYSAGGTAGTLLEFDNVFFYVNLDPQQPVTPVDPTDAKGQLSVNPAQAEIGQQVTFTVNVTPGDYTVNAVTIDVNGTKLAATAQGNLWTATWTAAAEGSYNVTAALATAEGKTFTSNGVNLTVKAAEQPVGNEVRNLQVSSMTLEADGTYTVVITYEPLFAENYFINGVNGHFALPEGATFNANVDARVITLSGLPAATEFNNLDLGFSFVGPNMPMDYQHHFISFTTEGGSTVTPEPEPEPEPEPADGNEVRNLQVSSMTLEADGTYTVLITYEPLFAENYFINGIDLFYGLPQGASFNANVDTRVITLTGLPAATEFNNVDLGFSFVGPGVPQDYQHHYITFTTDGSTTVTPEPEPEPGEAEATMTYYFDAGDEEQGHLASDGYLTFEWDGKNVKVTAHFNNPELYPESWGGNGFIDNAYFHNHTNGFAEVAMTKEDASNFTVTLEGYKPGDVVRGAVKIAYPEGMAITQVYDFTIPGNDLGDITSGIDSISALMSGNADVYTLNGVRVNAANLAPGFYIVVRGTEVTKILVK